MQFPDCLHVSISHCLKIFNSYLSSLSLPHSSFFSNLQKMSMLEDPTKLNEEDEEESEDQVNMKRYTETR